MSWLKLFRLWLLDRDITDITLQGGHAGPPLQVFLFGPLWAYLQTLGGCI